MNMSTAKKIYLKMLAAKRVRLTLPSAKRIRSLRVTHWAAFVPATAEKRKTEN